MALWKEDKPTLLLTNSKVLPDLLFLSVGSKVNNVYFKIKNGRSKHAQGSMSRLTDWLNCKCFRAIKPSQ